MEGRNMEAEEAAGHILYQEGTAVLVRVHVQSFLSFIKKQDNRSLLGSGLLLLGLFYNNLKYDIIQLYRFPFSKTEISLFT